MCLRQMAAVCAACNVCGDLTHGTWACPFTADALLDDPGEERSASPAPAAAKQSSMRHKPANKRSASHGRSTPADLDQQTRSPHIPEQGFTDVQDAHGGSANGSTYPAEVEVWSHPILKQHPGPDAICCMMA